MYSPPSPHNRRPDCQKQITGFVGAKYKKFDNQKEAEEFVRYGFKTPTKPSVRSTPSVGLSHSRPSPYAPTVTSARSRSSATLTTKAALKSTSASASESSTVSKGHSSDPNGVEPASDVLVIYTDGSSLSNGKVGSQAGVGVFFGVDDSRNVSERLNSEPQTNQRAELMVGSRTRAVRCFLLRVNGSSNHPDPFLNTLTRLHQAVYRALEVCGSDTVPIEIRTDSMYTVNGMMPLMLHQTAGLGLDFTLNLYV